MTALSAGVCPLEQYRNKRVAPKLDISHGSRSNHTLDDLRISAILADVDATADIELAALWRDLAAGARRVVDGFFSEERCYLVLSLENQPTSTPIEGRRLEILQAVLGGLRQKNIAIDLELAPSTVALNSRLALESLGVTGKPSRAHPLLMLTAQAARGKTRIFARRSTIVVADRRELTVIGIPRPDRRLALELPAAELSVVRRLVEGFSYSEIARYRGTSTRTIANQITSVFRRLKVSGRNDLVQRLLFDDVGGSSPAKPVAETLVPPGLVEASPDSSHDSSRRSA